METVSKKNYAQQALTDCKPFYIHNSTRYFFELEEIKGLGKMYLDTYLIQYCLI